MPAQRDDSPGNIDFTAINRPNLLTALHTLDRRLATEAEARGWCPAYEDFVRELNTEVGFMVLTPRGAAKRMQVTIEFDVDRRYMAPREDDVRDYVCRQAGRYESTVANLSVTSQVVEP